MTRRATERRSGPADIGTPMIACSLWYYVCELLDGLRGEMTRHACFTILSSVMLRVILCALRVKPFATNALGPTHSGVTP